MTVSKRGEQSKYAPEQLEAIAKKLRELPPVERKKEHFSRQEAVTRLKAEIALLQKRGYSLDQVSDALRGAGINIATPTLKSYLQRAKGTRTKARTEKPAAGKPAAAAASSVSGTEGLGRAIPATPNGRAAKSGKEQTPSKATFELKEDSEDI